MKHIAVFSVQCSRSENVIGIVQLGKCYVIQKSFPPVQGSDQHTSASRPQTLTNLTNTIGAKVVWNRKAVLKKTGTLFVNVRYNSAR